MRRMRREIRKVISLMLVLSIILIQSKMVVAEVEEDSIVTVGSGLVTSEDEGYEEEQLEEMVTEEIPVITTTTSAIVSVVPIITSDCYENQINIRWDSVEDATGYELEVDGIVNTITINEYEHKGLTANTSHSYKVRAVSENEFSQWSELITVATLPSTVPILTSQIYDKSIILMWNEVNEVTYYELEVDGVIKQVASNTFAHLNLQPKTSHTYRIRTIKGLDSSDWSPLMTCLTLALKGTQENPYMIMNKEELAGINNYPTAFYVLGCDIDLQGQEWMPIGKAVAFSGNLDGNGYKLSNMRISTYQGDNAGIGLFAQIKNGTIKNLTIENGNIENTIINADGTYDSKYGTNSYIGLLTGKMQGSSKIDNCHIESGTAIGLKYVGGLVGFQEWGTITNSSSKANITGINSCGGLVGQAQGEMSKSYAIGSVRAYGSNAGGLVGVLSSASNANKSKIQESYATGSVEANGYVGGLVGYVNATSGAILIGNCFALGNTTSSQPYSAGLIGYVKHNYSVGITNTYSAGKVTSSYLDAPIGTPSIITNCFFDIVATQQVNGLGKGKLTSEMICQETFNNWDFTDTWGIKEGISYPYLKNLPIPKEVEEELPVFEKADGEGTQESPYLIATKEQLSNIKYDLSPYFYKLVNDIDLHNEEWIPIGKFVAFSGNFDGNGYKISNLKISTYQPATMGIGLFSVLNNGTIKNLTIENGNIENTVIKADGTYESKYTNNSYVGLIVGKMQGSSLIDNCHVESGTSIGLSYVGGMVGFQEAGTISNCSSNSNITGINYCGGLVGQAQGAISKSYAIGSVKAYGSYVGGLVGSLYSANTVKLAKIQESYATGNVEAKGYIGGLVGYVNGTSGAILIENCYALAKTTASQPYCGGLIGYVGYRYNVSIINSYSAGKVASNYVDASIGSPSTITNCYFDILATQQVNGVGIGKITSAMIYQETFNNWNFAEIWGIKEGTSYPYLKNLPIPKAVEEGLPEIASGEGTQESPYLISTKEQLSYIKFNLSAYYKLINDIDLQNEEWTPIGKTVAFSGYLDGNGYKISNLKISTYLGFNAGLFAQVNNGTIKNLTIESGNIENSVIKSDGTYDSKYTNNSNVALLIGKMLGTSIIDNCHIESGAVTGISYVGGLVGLQEWGTITNSSSKANITGVNYCGGLIGQAQGELSKSYAIGSVRAYGSIAGGLVGSLHSASTVKQAKIQESYAAGNVEAKGYVGGLVGYVNSTIGAVLIGNCFALGNTTASQPYCGGLIGNVGYKYSVSITNSYSSGKVTSSYVDVSIGAPSTITSCYFDIVSTQRENGLGIGKLTSAMIYQRTFNNWNFTDIWSIKEGTSYPYLKNLPIPKAVEEGLPEIASGEGTQQSPYLISTKEQLSNIKYDLTSYYKLINDIDLQNEEWAPIGKSIAFSGNLDGDGYTISNMKISTYQGIATGIGLFAQVNNGTIKNLTIENGNIENTVIKTDGTYETKYASNSYVGLLAGKVQGTTIIDNCFIESGNAIGLSYVGGLVGSQEWGTITNSSSKANVTGISYCGGLVGQAQGEMSKSYAIGSVRAYGSYAGGLVGTLYSSSTVKQAKIQESYATGNVEAKGYVGGLVGYVNSTIGAVLIENSFALGNTTASQPYCGGLIGNVGYRYTVNVTNSYSAGRVTSSYVDASIGAPSTITNCYYDVMATQQVNGLGIGKLTSAMIYQKTFTNWDFTDVWSIKEGTSYPYLIKLSIPNAVEEGLPEIAVGEGTQESPYLISTKEQLINIKFDLSSYYRLINDIDLQNEEWAPIGKAVAFSGNLDGDGYKISNLEISTYQGANAGLFSQINNGTIKNLTIENGNIENTVIKADGTYDSKYASNSYVGLLAGKMQGSSVIDNCHVESGDVTGIRYVGGLVGSQEAGIIMNSSSKANITATYDGGGLVGQTQGEISKSYATGSVRVYTSYAGCFGARTMAGNCLG